MITDKYHTLASLEGDFTMLKSVCSHLVVKQYMHNKTELLNVLGF